MAHVMSFAPMDELLAIAIRVEKVFGEIGETPYEPLKDEREGKSNEGETSTKWHIHTLSETLIFFLKDQMAKKSFQS